MSLLIPGPTSPGNKIDVYLRLLIDELEECRSTMLTSMMLIPIVCRMKMIFRPSFFSIKIHMTIHLAVKVKLAGPMQYPYVPF